MLVTACVECLAKCKVEKTLKECFMVIDLAHKLGGRDTQQEFEKSKGLDILEQLQQTANKVCYQESQRILKAYYEIDDDD